MAITFLHAADIHLDSPLKGLERYENAPVGRIRGATRRAFTRLIDLAIEKSVDFVLIAGDLYDGDWRDYNTGLYLVRELNRLRDHKIPVFVIAGNHDAANKMTRALTLPDNVKLLAHDRPETAMLKDLDVAIHGQSFAKAAVTENLAAAYPAPVSGCVNIGLLHTGLGGADGHERYAPCTLEELRLRGYDYWALGHIHLRQVPCQDPPVVFAGNVQGRHIREAGPKGCLIVTVNSDRSFDPVFHRLDQVRWERGRVEVSELDTESDLLGRTAEMLDRLLADEPDPDVLLTVRVILSGTSTLHGRLNADPDRFVNEVRSLATELRRRPALGREGRVSAPAAERRDDPRRPDRGVAGRPGTAPRRSRLSARGRRRAGRPEAQTAGGVSPRPREPATGRGGVAANLAGAGAAFAPGPAPEIPGRRGERPRLDVT